MRQSVRETDGRLVSTRNGILPARTRASLGRATDPADASPPVGADAGRLFARFWGVRGSHPVAHTIGSHIGVNTACLEVRYGPHVLVLDAGSGIVALGEALAREWREQDPSERGSLSLLFTHAHHDHLCGLPFFAPLFQRDAELHLLGPDLAGLRFTEIIAGYMRSPYFPVDFIELPSRRHLRSVADGARLVWRAGGAGPVVWDPARPVPARALVVDVLHSRLHPRDGTLMYRISGGGHSLVFATDVEVGDGGTPGEQRFVRFARGADVLVHDAQYSQEDYAGRLPRRGYGHSTPGMAARVARAAEVDQLILFHHDPDYADADVRALEREAKRLFPGSRAAREGMEICLDAAAPRQV
jgi:ribonuclease BN (tRNA processing enzyme)